MKKANPVRRAPAQPGGGRREVDALTPSPDQGLTSAQVKERQAAGWANEAVDSPTKPVGQIVRENVFTFFNLIFVVLACCLVLVGSFKNMLFLVIAAANTVIGIVQQIRSKRTVDKLSLLSAPRCGVVRDGNLISVPSAQLVRDDIAQFAAGDQIPADAEVVEGSAQLNEALITGEADAIEKGPGDSLLSGSFVVAGRCRARLTHVGADSYAARLTLEAKRDVKVGRSEMMASLDKLIRIIGILLLPIGITLFVKQHFFLDQGVRQAVVSTVAALIGMIPEGLYLLTSVALAVGVIRLAKRKVLAQELSCIETLARVDVLCVDKTGTITEPRMEVGEVLPVDDDNDTARAMKARFRGPSNWRAARTVPFTSAAKWSAAVFPGHGAYVVGAPEFVMGERYAELRERVEPYSAKGYRVLLAAGYDGVPGPKGLDPGAVRPMALVLLSNRIRPEAPKTFRYFAQQGVAVKVISGDNPLTVSEVAAQAGIEHAEDYVDAATLKTGAELEQAARRYTVFGRVTPDQKRRLVRALQKAGHTVAMTGDGVNDVLALKDADCGIAMASGSDAACHAAQLVLLNSDFSAMPHVVDEGRRVINNIERAASLFLVKNIFSFFLAFITLFTIVAYPFEPIQLSLVGGLTIGAPAFFLALEPNHSLVRGRFMHNVLKAAFPGGLTDLVIILLAELFAFAFGFGAAELSTLCTLLMAFIGLLILFQVCKPFDVQRKLVWGAMAALIVGAVLLLPGLFSLVPLTLQTTLVLSVLMLLAYPVLMFMTRLFELGSAAARKKKGADA